MTPTHVFGQGAADYAQAKGWNDAVIVTDLSLNPKAGAQGGSPVAKRIISVAPGEYTGVDGYLGERDHVTLRGPDPKDGIAKFTGCGFFGPSKARELRFLDLELVDTPLRLSHPSIEGPMLIQVSRCYIHDSTGHVNGIGGPDSATQPIRWEITHNRFEQVGSPDNTKHTVYVHGRRPGDMLVFEDNDVGASRTCSQLKTDMWKVRIRRNKFRTLPAVEGGLTTHTMIDVASCADVVIYDNDFDVWRGAESVHGQGRAGIKVGGVVYFRRRRQWLGCDRPAPAYLYSVLDGKHNYTPTFTEPLSSIEGFPAGGPWDASPETYCSRPFWRARRRRNRADPENPLTFKKYVGGNRVTFADETPFKAMAFIQDDGTYPAFARGVGDKSCLLPVPFPEIYTDPSVTFYRNNTVTGSAMAEFDGNHSDGIDEEYSHPDALVRTLPEHFPFGLKVGDDKTWFKQ